MSFHLSKTVLSLLATAFALAPCHGQMVVDPHTRQWSHAFGNPVFGGMASASAEMTRVYATGYATQSNFSSRALLRSELRLFGKTHDGLDLDMTADNSPWLFLSVGSQPPTPISRLGYQPTSSILVRLRGETVWQESVQSPVLDRTWGRTLPLHDTPPITASISVLGIFVRVSVWATLGGQSSLRVRANAPTLDLQVTGAASATATGSASAAVGTRWAQAGIRTDLRLGNAGATIAVTGNPVFGINGTLAVSLSPIRFLINAYVRLFRRSFGWDVINLPLTPPINLSWTF
ncbi:MAG: hypothetical protein AB7O97_03775 [Planctomycetota bacterium]